MFTSVPISDCDTPPADDRAPLTPSPIPSTMSCSQHVSQAPRKTDLDVCTSLCDVVDVSTRLCDVVVVSTSLCDVVVVSKSLCNVVVSWTNSLSITLDLDLTHCQF